MKFLIFWTYRILLSNTVSRGAELVKKSEVSIMKIAVAGTGYVGLSLATLLSQHNSVTAVDIIEEKVDDLNKWISPIQDEYIEKFFKEAKDGERKLDLKAVLNNGKDGNENPSNAVYNVNFLDN